MSDRLEEIKQRNEDCRLTTEEVLKGGDLEWLISELENCKAENKKLKIEAAYRKGFQDGVDCGKESGEHYTKAYEENNVYEYMKALEDKDE